MRLPLLSLLVCLPLLITAATQVEWKLETGCGNDEKKSANLFTDVQLAIGSNRVNSRIEAIVPVVGSFEASITGKSTKTVNHTATEEALKDNRLDWTYVFAVTFRDNNGNDIGEDFFEYGYDSNLMHNTVKKSTSGARDSFADVNQKYNIHPFRFTTISMKSANQVKFEVSAACNTENPRAWIGQPGLFRLMIPKNDKPNFYFEPIYYWPRLNQLFT